MNKVASGHQIELCKQAAMARYAEYGILGKAAEDLYSFMLEKLAQTNAFAGLKNMTSRTPQADPASIDWRKFMQNMDQPAFSNVLMTASNIMPDTSAFKGVLPHIARDPKIHSSFTNALQREEFTPELMNSLAGNTNVLNPANLKALMSDPGLKSQAKKLRLDW